MSFLFCAGYGRQEKRAVDKGLNTEPHLPFQANGKKEPQVLVEEAHRWNWLVYSNAENGAFCHYRVGNSLQTVFFIMYKQSDCVLTHNALYNQTTTPLFFHKLKNPFIERILAWFLKLCGAAPPPSRELFIFNSNFAVS